MAALVEQQNLYAHFPNFAVVDWWRGLVEADQRMLSGRTSGRTTSRELWRHFRSCVFCGVHVTERPMMLAWWMSHHMGAGDRIIAAGLYCQGSWQGCYLRAEEVGLYGDVHAPFGKAARKECDHGLCLHRDWNNDALRRYTLVCAALAHMKPVEYP